MKDHTISLADKILLRKRTTIETINYELKKLYQIEHTRHRPVNNFIMNILGALTTYCLFSKKTGAKYSKIKGLEIVFSCRLNETPVKLNRRYF